MIFSSNFLKRWYVPKGPRWDMIFLVLSEKMLFFPENMIFFPWAESEMTFLKKYKKISYFLFTFTSVRSAAPRPSVKKN